MFGRLRPPPSSPECLERYPAKMIKDDPLSIYESTLLKLKQGSKLDTNPYPEPETENLPSSSDATLSHSSDAMAIDSEELKNKNPSVSSMFCRYNQARNSSHSVDNTTTTETHIASSQPIKP